MKLGIPCFSFGIQHLHGYLPFEGAAKVVAALGCDTTAIGWAHVDWPKVRADPVAAADDVLRVTEPLGLEVDDSLIRFRKKYLTELKQELKCTITRPDPAAREDNLEMPKSFVTFCTRIGCPGIPMSSGVKYAEQGFSYEEIYRISRAELTRMVDYAGERGVEIRPEPHGKSVMGTIENALRMLEEVPGLRIALDYSHFMPQGPSIEDVNVRIPHAGHVHARQANRERLQCRHEVGILDFEAIVKALVAHGYKGNIAVEYVSVNYRGCNDIDVVTESLKLREDLVRFLEAHDPGYVPARAA